MREPMGRHLLFLVMLQEHDLDTCSPTSDEYMSSDEGLKHKQDVLGGLVFYNREMVSRARVLPIRRCQANKLSSVETRAPLHEKA